MFSDKSTLSSLGLSCLEPILRGNDGGFDNTAVIIDSIQPVQRSSWGGERFHPLYHGRVLFERRGVVRLAAGIYDQGAGAPPMFGTDELPDTVDVRRRVGAGEGHPEEIIQAR